MNFLSITISFFLINSMSCDAQEKLTFESLDNLFAYAETNSVSFHNANQQNILAKYQILVSKLGMFNLKGTSSFTLTNNTKLNPNFIPAEVFGGQEGTFTSVTFGQKYVSNFTFEPQIDLINPYAMAQIKVAKTNEQLIAVTNLLTKKVVYESISATYHNILSYRWQIDITVKSLSNSESLVLFLQNKQKEGLTRSQDVNIVLANQLIVKDKLQQLEIQLQQQYNILKILCDINPETTIIITGNEKPIDNVLLPIKATGDLLQRQGEWQTKYHQARLRANKKWMYPTLNLFSSFSWQESNNNNFFGTNNWFTANYIGLKLSFPILPEVSKIAAVKYDKINLEIAQNNWNHNKLQDQINNEQLELEYRKSNESYKLAIDIEALRKDSYEKNLNIYREGIISTTDLINSLNDWLNSSLNTVTLLAAVEFSKNKIIISNLIK